MRLASLPTTLLSVVILLAACSDDTAPQVVPSQDAPPQRETPFDPDDAELSQLIFWGPLDFGFGQLLPIPYTVQLLTDQLLASDSPAANKYIIDLAAYPNPLRDQMMLHLAQRFGANHQTVYEYDEIWDFHPSDSDTTAYLRFKQALYAASLQEISRFLDPDASRTIDAREVQWGGVSVDGIPPLEHPDHVTPADAAAWINDSDIVVGVKIEGDARAYPIRIIAWHEMVNDTIGGVPVSLAYCTLCGSAILFDGRVGSGVFRFGTSGLLYRSNKLMYDRQTRTLWNQFSGKPAWGPLVDEDITLEVLPVVVTTWQEWRDNHANTTVLSINTGHHRDYGPGVAYNDYFNSQETWFNVPIADDRLNQKDNVYVVRIGDRLKAYPIEALAEQGLIEDEIGGEKVVVLSTPDGNGARAYERADEQFTTYNPEEGILTDQSGQTWTIAEEALQGPNGQRLERRPSHNAYWFAITNHSEGELWQEED